MSKSYAGVEDLLSDESFLSWYFKTDSRAVGKWERWIAAHPGSYYRVEQAVEFLRSLHFQEAGIAEGQITLAESRLLEKIRAAEQRTAEHRTADQTTAETDPAYPRLIPVRKLPQQQVRIWQRRRWLTAASVLLLAAGLYGGYRLRNAGPELHTSYGEVKRNRLPDGTEVMVNADSRIRYSSDWKDGKDREVWLTGEAFFHVRKTLLKSRFIVHTDRFDIIVTGTQFNVVSRPDKANVMLKEGSVILHTPEGKELRMAPGDFVEYNSARLEKRSVRNDSVLAWKDNKLLFDNTPIQDVANIIHEHYGVTVQLDGDSVANKTVSGIMANDNLDVLLKALEVTSDFEILREGDKIIIRNHS